MNITEKYKAKRSELKTGDIILYSASSTISYWTRIFDNAYFTHCGILWRYGTRVLTMDMWSEGLCVIPASKRISEHLDFAILRPNVEQDLIDKNIIDSLELWEGNVSYDYFMLLRIALQRKLGVDLLRFLGSKKKMICSEFTQWYCNNIGIYCYKNMELITPQDFMRYKNDQFTVMFDDSTPSGNNQTS